MGERKQWQVILSSLVLILLLGGCIRATTVTHERVDQELEGNRGFIAGTPPPPKETIGPKESKVIEIEVDFPPSSRKKESGQEVWGNRGYLKGSSKILEEREQIDSSEGRIKEPEDIVRIPRDVEKKVYRRPMKEPVEEESVVPSPAVEEKGQVEPIEYKVKKGDSLWKLARKFYGDPRLWKKIYDANKDKIKNPNRIYPGQVLKIPPKA